MAWVLSIELPKRWMLGMMMFTWIWSGANRVVFEGIEPKWLARVDSMFWIEKGGESDFSKNCTFMWKAWSRPVSTGTIPSWHWPRVVLSNPLLFFYGFLWSFTWFYATGWCIELKCFLKMELNVHFSCLTKSWPRTLVWLPNHIKWTQVGTVGTRRCCFSLTKSSWCFKHI